MTPSRTFVPEKAIKNQTIQFWPAYREIFLRIYFFRTGTSSMKAALAQLLPGRFDTFCEFAFAFVYLYFWISFFLLLYLHSSCLGGLILVSCICSPFHMFPFSLSLSSIWRSGTTIDFRFLHFLLPLNFTHLPLIWYFFTILILEPTTQWTCCKMSTIRQDKYFHKLFCLYLTSWVKAR